MAPIPSSDHFVDDLWTRLPLFIFVTIAIASSFVVVLIGCLCCCQTETKEEELPATTITTDIGQMNEGDIEQQLTTNDDGVENAVAKAEEAIAALFEESKATSLKIEKGLDGKLKNESDAKRASMDQSMGKDESKSSLKSVGSIDGKQPIKSQMAKLPDAKSSPKSVRVTSRSAVNSLRTKSPVSSSKLLQSKKSVALSVKSTTASAIDVNAPVVIPASSKHTATVIFMHGLGDTGHGWTPVFQMIRSPHVKYICPTAPTIPVTLNMGMQMPSWFDIRGLNINADEDEQGIKKAAKAVHSWIDEEVKSGIPSERILLGGFSQGGGLALYSALTYDKPLAGVIGLSCWLPLHKQIPGTNQANKKVSILQCHGDADPLVWLPIGQMTAKMLESFNSNHTFKVYPGLGHSTCKQEIQDMKQFIEQRLPSK